MQFHWKIFSVKSELEMKVLICAKNKSIFVRAWCFYPSDHQNFSWPSNKRRLWGEKKYDCIVQTNIKNKRKELMSLLNKEKGKQKRIRSTTDWRKKWKRRGKCTLYWGANDKITVLPVIRSNASNIRFRYAGLRTLYTEKKPNQSFRCTKQIAFWMRKKSSCKRKE